MAKRLNAQNLTNQILNSVRPTLQILVFLHSNSVIVYHRLLHITLALSVLLSTTGISVYRHFCQDKLMSTAMFVKPHGCKMAKHRNCHSGGHCAKKEVNSCCNDTLEFHQIDQDKQITPTLFKLLKQPMLLSLPWPVFLAPATISLSKVLPYLHYRPPLIRGTLPALLQVFRF